MKDKIKNRMPEISIYILLIIAVIGAILWLKYSERQGEPKLAPLPMNIQPIAQAPISRTDYTLTEESTQSRLDWYENYIVAPVTPHELSQVDEYCEVEENNAYTQELTESDKVVVESAQVALSNYQEITATITSLSMPTSLDGVTLTYFGNIFCTGYDPYCRHCGSSTGATASGITAVVGRTVAMNGIRFGTEIYIEGIGFRIVEDRGPMPGYNIDIACIDHEACYAITGIYRVFIVDRENN